MKRKTRMLTCLLSLFLLTSCAAAANPLTRAQSTPVPGLPMPEHVLSSPAETADTMEITLFFRYQQTGLLACETRTIQVPNDESTELAVVRQLLAGPQASHADLVRLFPHNTTVVNVTSTEDTLMVTLSEGLLNDGLPADWADDPAWKKRSAPAPETYTAEPCGHTDRELLLSLCASLYCPRTGFQCEHPPGCILLSGWTKWPHREALPG